MEEKDNVVLSFHDSLLHKSDFKLLNAPYWINDKIIGFIFEYFEKVQFQDYKGNVCYISPDVGQFIKCVEDSEVAVFLDPLILSEKDYIFVAVNDNMLTETSGGSHWSLLLYDRKALKFFHYDSLGHGSNFQSAKLIAKKLANYITGSPEFEIKEAECALQSNGYDCGMYVIYNVELLSNQLLRKSNEVQLTAVTEKNIELKRQEIKDLIINLSKSKP